MCFQNTKFGKTSISPPNQLHSPLNWTELKTLEKSNLFEIFLTARFPLDHGKQKWGCVNSCQDEVITNLSLKIAHKFL